MTPPLPRPLHRTGRVPPPFYRPSIGQIGDETPAPLWYNDPEDVSRDERQRRATLRQGACRNPLRTPPRGLLSDRRAAWSTARKAANGECSRRRQAR